MCTDRWKKKMESWAGWLFMTGTGKLLNIGEKRYTRVRNPVGGTAGRTKNLLSPRRRRRRDRDEREKKFLISALYNFFLFSSLYISFICIWIGLGNTKGTRCKRRGWRMVLSLEGGRIETSQSIGFGTHVNTDVEQWTSGWIQGKV
jgi:hypothetical protein